MSISFNEIPNSLLVPGFWTEFDNSNAGGNPAMPWKVLLIGSMLSASGSAKANIPVQVFSGDQADVLFGKGSQAALMARAFLKNNTLLPLYVAGVADGTAAAHVDIPAADITASSVEAGALNIMVGGQSIIASVDYHATVQGVMSAIVDAINDAENLPVTAALDPASSSTKIVVTAKNKGTAGNSIAVDFNFYEGEVMPEGLSIASQHYQLAGGSGDPDVSDVIENIGAQWFNIIVTAFDGSLNAIRDELDSRWTATRQMTGVCFYGYNGDESGVKAKANKNSQVCVCLPLCKSPTPAFEIASFGAGAISTHAEADPAMPLTNWVIKGIVAPKNEDRLSMAQENQLLLNGASLINADASGNVYMRRIVTTYLKNSAGGSDTSYQQLETIFTLSFLRWDWNNYMAGKYPHAKLAQDGYTYGPGQVVMTPKRGKAEALARFAYWQELALVQNYDDFKANLVVEINPSNKNRLDFLLPATLMGQLFTCASKIQFK